MGDVFYGLFFAVIYVFLFMFFVNCFTEKRNRNVIRTNFYIILWIVIEVVFALIGMNNIILRIVFVPICSTVFIYLLNELSIMQAFFISIIFYGIGCVIDYSVYITYNGIIKKYVIYSSENTLTSMLLAITSQMIELVVISVISSFKGNHFFTSLRKKDWLLFCVFPFFSILVTLMLMMNFGENNNISQNYTLMIISGGFLILNFFELALMNEIMNRETKIRETQLMYERASHTAQRYYDKAENYEVQKKREHEFVNHLTVIHNLISSEKYERAKTYTENLCEQEDDYIDIIDTNHPIINAVINMKYKEAIEKGIFMTFDVCDIAEVGVSDNDITVIVSNMLNNAIEACEMVDNQNAFIRFKMNKEDKRLYISVINSYSGKINRKNGVIMTSKDNKAQHGIGIKNIIDAVKRNRGEYVIDVKDSLFCFIVCFPN